MNCINAAFTKWNDNSGRYRIVPGKTVAAEDIPNIPNAVMENLIIQLLVIGELYLQVIHSKGDEDENQTPLLSKASEEEEELPPWLSKELREGDFIPMPENEDGGCVSSKCTKNQVTPIRYSTTSSCDNYQKLENSDLLLMVEKLERANQALTKKIEEQEDVIRALRKQNEIYAENNKKLFKLSSKTGPL